MQSIDVKKPVGTFEQARFDSQLKELGFDAADRVAISEEEADRYVNGGFTTLLDAAKKSGDPNSLDENDLDFVSPRYGAEKSILQRLRVVRKPEKRADKKIQTAVDDLGAAVSSLNELDFVKTSGTLLSFFENVNAAARSLEGAMAQKTLGRGSRDQVKRLKDALESFEVAYSRLQGFKVGEITALGSAADTVQNFPHNFRYITKEIPRLLDRPVRSVSIRSF